MAIRASPEPRKVCLLVALKSKTKSVGLTAGVDPHTDDFHGPVLLVVLHNDGLKFRQGKVSYTPGAGDWFIFNDCKKHRVSSAPGRATFVGWAIPLEPIYS